MHDIQSSGKAKLPVIKIEALATEIKIFKSVFILTTVIDKEIAEIKASFLAN